jgi:YYY domain-containing protein
MTREKHPWIYDVLFLLVFLLAGYLRLTGINWGEGQHQHPDENFLTGVLGSLRAHTCMDESVPVDLCPPEQQRWMTLGEYFDSETSALNPYNRGYAFFVYGNLPMTLVRITAEATEQFDVKTLGRQFSALADLFTIFFLYLLVSRMYGRKVGLLASLFSALTVMQIQQSHFFTTDLFVNAFAFLAIYFAVEILNRQSSIVNRKSLISHPLFLLSLGFGFAFGMAMASKVNIYPLVVLLPGAFALRYFITDRHTLTTTAESQTEERDEDSVNHQSPSAHRSPTTGYWAQIIVFLIAGGLAAFISFRVFQPYAFDGLLPSEQWVANIQEQRIQAKGDADLPWNLQWARRDHLYSFTNLTTWGLGLPLGILAWIGFLYMGWRILKGEWRHALLWGWTAAYFIWQSLQFNPTMRYQLPIYPLLAMMAAWFVFELAGSNVQAFKRFNFSKIFSIIIGLTVIILTAAWAFAFQSIYLRDEPRVAASRWIFQNVPGPINVQYQTSEGIYNQPLPFPSGGFVEAEFPYETTFVANADGLIESIKLGYAANISASPSTVSLILSEVPESAPEQVLATASLTGDFPPGEDSRGSELILELDRPVPAAKGQQFYLRFSLDSGRLDIRGAAVVNETDYDYGLPFRLDGYDAFGGIYRGDLNLQVYWDDNEEKLERFVSMLSEADYIFIPTNHQYGQITRLPERYPLTTMYYRELMGCPVGADIISCYHEAQPGDHQGRLGFDLVAVFETFPRLDLPLLGRIEINDQYAEEAFTFYDHPKVFIFKKNADFDAGQVHATLETVDLSKVVRLTPRQFDEFSSLLLPADRLASQRAGGTWSDLFDYNWLQNRYPVIGLLIWYLFIFILGLAVYPIVRLAMPGLADKGYPLSRALGLVIFAYLAWLAGSVGIPYTRTTIAIVFGVIFVTGAVLGHLQRDALIEEFKTKYKYFLTIEGLFLAFFLVDLLIRLGNPDLWHPAKGGERPMDFSYFNAVIKSTSFPPYDPWFADGYINYYYYGFVIVGTPVKLLGIVPSIAYNFILPTLFATVGISAFSLGWNLLQKDEGGRMEDENSFLVIHPSSFVSGLSASLLAILLGNLGTLQLIYQKMQQLGAAGMFSWESSFFQRLTWAWQGLMLTFKGIPLPIGPGDWYWNPSRVVPPGPDNSITEFPLFTFLYSDLHAHMIVMPIALLALSWALSVVAARARWQNQASAGLGLVVGGLIVGAAYPTNLSDSYTYLLICIIALGYSILRYSDRNLVKRIGLAVGAMAAFYLLSRFLYEPYRIWYSQAYSALEPWKGPFTPLASYLTMWGVFLFILVSWMTWETREWMRLTPLSALQKLKPYQLLIEGALIALVILLFTLQYHQLSTDHDGLSIAWIALPIAAWAGILLLNPHLSDAKRFVLFLIGTGLFITILVEVFVVRGDIGRQNTIFKFYMQVWLMLAASAGAAFAWTLPAFFQWLPGWRVFWQSAMIFLISATALFTVTGTRGKIIDRWIAEAPRTLDAMTFMEYAHYDDFGQRLDLSEDYRAIRWMQDNVQGSPVIVEANCPEYRWCTRFTIYTGLPGVVGWNWHQRQQRVFTSPQVQDRVNEVGDFYNGVNIESVRRFLRIYGVRYIVVGQLERAAYEPAGITKFERYEGTLWRSVYRDGQTVIYEVLP